MCHRKEQKDTTIFINEDIQHPLQDGSDGHMPLIRNPTGLESTDITRPVNLSKRIQPKLAKPLCRMCHYQITFHLK